MLPFATTAVLVYGGYVPGLSEAGRVTFPLFALVMAYNLAPPGADPVKSVRRLGMWGLIAQPVHALAFGYWLPLNILLTFALCAAAIHAAGQRKWIVLAFASAVLPAFVDYQ
ncbi:TPA: TraX family protein [Stenotrophomonas maltophilia]